LRIAYVGEYGREAGEQSSLNFITLVGTDVSDPTVFALYGLSDQRYKVLGGNDQVIKGLADRLAGQVLPEHRLVALRTRGAAHRLTFDRPGAGPLEVDADYVLLAIPFTTLRDVAVGATIPDWKKRVIDQLGYGDSSKIFLGVSHRAWRDDGYNGGAYSDVGFQNSWDSNQLEPGPASSLTLFLGGQTALQSGSGTPDQQAASFLPGVEAVFPGTTAAFNGRTARAYWPGNPYIKAGYACWLPGQWTTIAGSEILPVGNILGS
jgi:monoamine oxidase